MPPSEFGPIVEGLRAARPRRARRARERAAASWTRVVFEKPFGHDLESARALNDAIASAFDESQVFRIDHYLGKETVQNLLVFRFANSLFEPVWNREHVDHVQITVAEEIGVEGRGKFYEQTGVTRDIVENHLMQLLCLTAMEPPISLSADAVRDEKVKVLRSLRPMERSEVRAQRRARAVRARHRARRRGPRLPRGARRVARVAGRDVRRDAACSSTTGAGAASPSTCAPASGWRGG